MKKILKSLLLFAIPLVVFAGVQYSNIGSLYRGTMWDSPSYLSSDRETLTSVSGAANTLTSKIQKQAEGKGSLWIKGVAINTTLKLNVNRGNTWVEYTMGTINSSGDSVEVMLSDTTFWQDRLTHEYQYIWEETGNQSNEYNLYEWKTVHRY